MTATQSIRNAFARRFALAAAFAFCAACCGGCLMDSPSEAAAPSADAPVSGPEVGAKTQADPSPAATGIPRGCTREWSAGAMDSVLYCPDIRPPKPY